MQKGPPTPKGFRDIDPAFAKKRRQIINQIAKVLEDAGFEPLETPTVEFAQTLKGKYGEEERLIYEFKDRGGRDLALRYDLTVPLARYVANNNPKLPFRRYQIGQVFRGENPQAGRFREFTQFDFDTVGSEDMAQDSQIIATAIKAVKAVGISKCQIKINDRKNFEDVDKKVVIALDKLEKVGEEKVIYELTSAGFDKDKATTLLAAMRDKKPTPDLETIFAKLEKLGITKGDYAYDPLLARGLDYYTGAIFELRVPSYGNLSIGSGGRYDNLIGMFAQKQIPAVGFSFGIDRLIEALS